MISDDLSEWKNKKDRKPLLLEGVRQCGKTYVLKEFGEQHYKDVAYFNFEKTPELCELFQSDLDPKDVIDRLSLRIGRRIEPGSTLIIFDEISFCNRALTSLKYFCEEAPEYHIACAGSFLGVMLSKPYPFPVGKVDRLRMGPMNFKEFLLANSEEYLVEYMDGNDPTEYLSRPVIEKLRNYLDHYFIIGGMPAAVSAWVNEKDIGKVEDTLDGIIDDYMDDLTRHASESFAKITLIWGSVPIQLAKENKKFMFGHVKAGARAKDLEDALQWLVNARMVHKVKRVDPPNVPLPMNARNTDFKIYLADIGILRRMAKLPPNFLFSKDKEFDVYRGMIAENYVHNEIIASTGDVLYYWRSNNIAEVDFIAQTGLAAVPIEVKAGGNRSKSLTEYISRNSPPVAVVASLQSGKSGIVHNIPLYAAWRIFDHIMKMTERNE
jgi:predicted AAA+ superfamily ATPase